VADRLFEKASGRKTGGPSVLLVENPLCLEQQGLPEALRSDDDELVVSIRTQETVDLRRSVKERLVEILGDVDVISVHGPRSHVPSKAKEGSNEGAEDTAVRTVFPAR